MKIIDSIPSPNDKYLLQLYVDDDDIYFERGEIDYFNSRGPGQMAINHTSFYLDTGDKHIYFDDFSCLYRYGSFGWWDSDSRYFYFASGVNLVFIFDCQENKWVEISSPIYFFDVRIKSGIIEIKGGSEIDITDTVKVSGKISSKVFQLSNFNWQTEGIEIKEVPRENTANTTSETDYTPYYPTYHPPIAPKEERRFPLKLRNIIGMVIFTAISIPIAIIVKNYYIKFSLISFQIALIPFLFLSDSGELDEEGLPTGVYKAWIIRRFVPLTAVLLLVINMILVNVISGYKQTPLSSILFVVAFFYPIYAVLSVIGNIMVLNNYPEYNKICKERYRSERKDGRSLFYYFWKANIRKLLEAILFFGVLALLIYVVTSLISKFSG